MVEVDQMFYGGAPIQQILQTICYKYDIPEQDVQQAWCGLCCVPSLKCALITASFLLRNFLRPFSP